jgi:hypothetical protein
LSRIWLVRRVLGVERLHDDWKLVRGEDVCHKPEEAQSQIERLVGESFPSGVDIGEVKL